MTEPIHGDWTGADVKNYLPDVRVKVDGRVIDNCQVCGRLNKFATVFVKGSKGFYRVEYAWETIAHSINTGNPLLS
jgi:hypothetical protein